MRTNAEIETLLTEIEGREQKATPDGEDTLCENCDVATATRYICPKCKKPLERVRQGANSMLNEYQFDAVKAGDWFCECHNNEWGNSPYAYFWDKEVKEEQ